MTPLEMTPLDEHTATGPPGALHLGLYPATVTALADDPENRQRIEVSFDWLASTADDTPPTGWATLITPYADADQGMQLLPEIGSTVVVGFQAGYLDHPYVVGAVWNGNATAPESFTDANDVRLIRTRSGSVLRFDDADGAVSITVETPGGHRLVLDDGGSSVTVSASNGASIELNASGGVVVQAASTVQVSAAAVTVDAAASTFNGMVICDSLIARSGGVVSPMYTPGAGNIW